MATQYVPIDRAERDFASAELDELAYACDGEPWLALKQALLEWHLRTLAVARSEAWIPGLAKSREPAVEKLLERFYSHHMAAAIKRIRAENVELRRKLLELAPRGSGGAGPSARSSVESVRATTATQGSVAPTLRDETIQGHTT